ncbi:apolipoprotein N-acyltransferase [Actinotalea fermentans]|uniref:apolipoprotein N-acyltransferase n=1 Tax=Actinotalea fermentans TaxID=43671 RepID=UPI0021C1D1FB|nr:apolipoprotein N-acyltransferase [Actinotalea fermentans]
MLLPTPRRRATLLLAVGGGVLTEAGFPGLGWWPLTVLGLALLFVALARDSARWNALVGLVFGLALFVPHVTFVEAAVGLVPWLALATAEAGLVALFAAAWAWARRGEVIWGAARLQIPVFAALWVAVEELRSVWPFGGFPWGRLAFAQADSPLGRWAWAGGVPLVSFLVAAAGAVLALGLVALRRANLGRASGALLGVALIVVSGVFLPLSSAPTDGRLEVGAVQGNVPDRGLDSFSQAREVLRNHVTGTEQLAQRVERPLDVVLWPENSTDIDPRADAEAADLVTRAAQAVGAPILVGTDHYPESGGRLNSALLWDPQTGPGVSYDKLHPTPFAEYIPLRSIARAVSDAVDRVRTDMIPGSAVGALDVEVPRLDRTVTLGVGICFEVAYDDIIRNTVQDGAELIVIPTNNATFGRTDLSVQQLAMSRIRAMEHGRATVQISTVGVSALIDPAGVILERTEHWSAEQMSAALPLRSSLTPATRFGDAVVWAFRGLGVAVVLAGMAGAARVRRSDRALVDA